RKRVLEMDRGTADQSRFWADLRQCRNESIVYHMNVIADLLKREVANVPVLYTYTQQGRIFTNTQTSGGFDGLGVSAYGRGSSLVTGGADAAYSQAAESRKTTLPFPSSAAGLVKSGPLPSGGVWWVPSTAPGRPLEFGFSYAGYTIALPEGDTLVLWSLNGPRETRLLVGDPRSVQVLTPDGRPVEFKSDLKRRTVTLRMDQS